MSGGGERRILIACMGNALRGDDGFGVAVAEALDGIALPAGVHVIEVGIGGIHVVQELLEGYDRLIVVDAVDRGATPGSLFVLEPRVPDPRDLRGEERRRLLADAHHTVPSRALLLARALGVLPDHVLIVGCQPEGDDDLRIGLSPPVRRAVDEALTEIRGILGRWPGPGRPSGAGRRGAGRATEDPRDRTDARPAAAP